MSWKIRTRNILAAAAAILLLGTAIGFGTTITKSLIGKQDLSVWDGSSTRTFTRDSSAGYTLTLNNFDWVGVDVHQAFGGGVNRNDTILSAAQSAAAGEKRILWLSPGTWTISNDLTLASNLIIDIPPGAIFSVASGKTLTIHGPIRAENYQIFSGSGSVAFANGAELRLSWFNDFETAIDSVGTNKVSLLIDMADTISADTTVYKNTTLKWSNSNNVLTLAAGVALTVNGKIDAPSTMQIFDPITNYTASEPYTDIIDFDHAAVAEQYPQWYGATVDNPEIQVCIDISSSGPLCKIPADTYLLSAPLKFYDNSKIYGAGHTNTQLYFNSGTHGFIPGEDHQNTTYATFNGLYVRGSKTANTVGIYLLRSSRNVIRDCYISDFGIGVYMDGRSTVDDGYESVAFTSGGTTRIRIGDTIVGATSSETADVVWVDLTSGSWANGDAVGTLYIEDKSGSFTAENLNIQGGSSNVATIAGDSSSWGVWGCILNNGYNSTIAVTDTEGTWFASDLLRIGTSGATATAELNVWYGGYLQGNLTNYNQSGNTDGIGSSTNVLKDTGQDFTLNVKVGWWAYNTTDDTKTTITAVTSDTELGVSDDIFDDGEDYVLTPYFVTRAVYFQSGQGNGLFGTHLSGARIAAKFDYYRNGIYNAYIQLTDTAVQFTNLSTCYGNVAMGINGTSASVYDAWVSKGTAARDNLYFGPDRVGSEIQDHLMVDKVKFWKLNAEPTYADDGEIVFADGSSWDPNGGGAGSEGIWRYDVSSDTWILLDN